MRTLLVMFNQESEYLKVKLSNIPKEPTTIYENSAELVLRMDNKHLDWNDHVTGLLIYEESDDITILMEK